MIRSCRSVNSAFHVLIGTSLVMSLAALAPCDEPSAKEIAPLPQKDNFHLYLLIGQSNMVGRNKPQPEDKQVHPRIVMLNQERNSKIFSSTLLSSGWCW